MLALREAWYRRIRAPLGRLAWWLWSVFPWVPDAILSRRNLVIQLPELTQLSVDPRCVHYYVLDADVRRQLCIWPGDWDRRALPLEGHYRYQLITDVWQHRAHLEDSESFAHYQSALEQARPAEMVGKGLRLDTRERILDYLGRQLDLLDSLRRDGFLTGLAPDELNVAVGRDGTLYKANAGRKRFMASRILVLPAVPVRIAYLHPLWLRRHRAAGMDRPAVLRAALETIHERHGVTPPAGG